MVSAKGFYLDIDGEYKDIEDNEGIDTNELDHSEYGIIKYVVYNEVTYAVNWSQTEELVNLPELQEGWAEEIA